MTRKIAAALAFNVYALVFVQTLRAATPFLFHGSELAKLKNEGLPFRLEDWDFGDHYLWRLLAAIVSTLLSALICGAIAREKGGKVALLANIPSVFGWIAYAWMFFYPFDNIGTNRDAKQEVLQTAYGVVSIIAIPVTCWLSMKGGEIGQRFQVTFAQQGRTLGIADWHWAWLWLPISAFGYRILINIVTFIGMLLAIWADKSLSESIFGSLLLLLGIVIVAAWTMPLVLTYQSLAGHRFQEHPSTHRGAIIAAILIGGYFVALAVHHVLAAVLEQFGF